MSNLCSVHRMPHVWSLTGQADRPGSGATTGTDPTRAGGQVHHAASCAALENGGHQHIGAEHHLVFDHPGLGVVGHCQPSSHPLSIRIVDTYPEHWRNCTAVCRKSQDPPRAARTAGPRPLRPRRIGGRSHELKPCGFNNSAVALIWGYVAVSYSLIRPPRILVRVIRWAGQGMMSGSSRGAGRVRHTGLLAADTETCAASRGSNGKANVPVRGACRHSDRSVGRCSTTKAGRSRMRAYRRDCARRVTVGRHRSWWQAWWCRY
jgi:hypothetical protein